MDLSNFDFGSVEVTEQNFELVPNGDYKACIVSSEQKLTKKAQESGNPADGTMLVLRYQILDGPHAGRQVFQNLNFLNASEQAQSIGRQQLAAVFGACGVTAVGDSSELHDIPLTISLIVKAGTNGYSDRNEVKKVKKARQGSPAPVPASAPVQSQPAPQADNPVSGW
jgi:hypothetical protein